MQHHQEQKIIPKKRQVVQDKDIDKDLVGIRELKRMEERLDP
jgi:hypothetical protein